MQASIHKQYHTKYICYNIPTRTNLKVQEGCTHCNSMPNFHESIKAPGVKFTREV
ncbi:hypothetical protein HanIR_Chr09g0404741 [Helianthus annuus]|nr:hypothetical protein HanIR_Chr09g0404741 [Helianthus annuus]